MKELLPAVAAGGTFAGGVLLGLAAGILAGRQTGNQLWVLAGLFGGMVFGGYGALRLLLRSGK